MLGIPGCALFFNYVLNIRYLRLWNIIDPDDPVDFEAATLKEIKDMNYADENFDKWNRKYVGAAANVKRIVILLSHKFFLFPFTHFFGYLHFTLRTQDHRVIWQWNESDCNRYIRKRLSQKKVEHPSYKFRGRLVP